MATTIGKLNLKLAVSPEALVAGLEAAQKKVKTFVGTAFVSFKRMIDVGGMVEDVFNRTIGSILDANSVFTRIDDMAKFADRVGISTEAMAGFEHAAKLSGVSLSQLRSALENSQRIFGFVSFASDKTATSLEKFGLNMEALSQLSMEDRIGVLADAYNRLQDPLDRSALAVAAFGRGGQQVQKFLENGAQGLRTLTEEAGRLGLSFSRMDAAGIERARDAVTRLQSVFEGIRRQAAIQIAPLISAMAEKMLEFLKNGPGVARIVQMVADVIYDIIAAVVKMAEKVATTFNKILREPERVGFQMQRTAAQAQQLSLVPGMAQMGHLTQEVIDQRGLAAPIDNANVSFQAFLDNLEEARNRTRQMIDGFGEAAKAKPWSALLGDLSDFAEKLEMQTANFGKSAEQLQVETFKLRGAALEAAVGRDAADLKLSREAIGDMSRRLLQLQAAARNLSDQAAAGIINPQTAKAAIAFAQRYEARLDAMVDRMREQKKAAEEGAGALADFNFEMARIDAEIQNLADAKIFEEMKKEAADLERSLLTPFDMLKEKIISLHKLSDAGLLSPKALGQLEKLAAMEAGKALGLGEVRLAAGLQEGSAEAVSAVNRAAAQVQNPNAAVEKLLEKVREQLAAGAKRQEDLLALAVGAVQDGDRRQEQLLGNIAAALRGGNLLPP